MFFGKIKKSIVNRISFWFVLTATALAFASVFGFYLSLRQTLAIAHRNIVTERIQTLRSVLERKNDPLPAAKRRIESEWANISFEHIFIRLRNADGSVVSISPDTPPEVLHDIFPTSESLVSRSKRKVSNSGNVYIVASEPFTLGGSSSQLYADLAFDITSEESILRLLRTRLIFIIGVVLISSFFFGRKLAVTSLLPVRRIALKADAIRSSNLHERLDSTNLPAELELLVETFNRMFDRLSDSFTRMSQFSSDLAHELRTPVNNIRGEIEVTLAKNRSMAEYKDTLSSSLEELERISKIMDSLLFIAKSENPTTQLGKDPCNLKDELENIAEFYKTTTNEGDVSVTVDAPANLLLNANRTLFQRAVSNLVSNALAHTAPGGAVSIKGSEAPDGIVVSVSDTGEGIAPEHLSKIFDRFYRADPSRSGGGPIGFGLGLAIVQGIVKLHGGKIEAKSKVGEGTNVTLRFPKNPDQLTKLS
jgi:two-component system heavy metal sensor histidine kinase CusS